MIMALAMPLAAVLPTTPAAAMIGWEHTAGTVDLYRIDGSLLVRSTCPSGAVSFDPATCAAGVRRAPLAEALSRASAQFGERIETCQAAAEAEAGRIQRIDLRLLELLSWSPDAAAPELARLQQQIDDLSDQELAQASIDADLRSQIALIEQRLEAAGADELALLATLRQREQGTSVALQATRAALSAEREELVRRLADDSGGDEFRGLQTQRARLVADFNAQGRCVADEVQERVDFTKALQMLANQALDYEVSALHAEFARYDPAMQALGSALAALDGVDDVVEVLRYGSWGATPLEHMWELRFGLPVTEEGLRYGSLACSARYEHDTVGYRVVCDQVRVHTPGGVFAMDSHRELGLERDGVDLATEIPELGAYAGPAMGMWTVTMQCYSPFPDNPDVLSSCSLTLLK
jgi:hypothetical protein